MAFCVLMCDNTDFQSDLIATAVGVRLKMTITDAIKVLKFNVFIEGT